MRVVSLSTLDEKVSHRIKRSGCLHVVIKSYHLQFKNHCYRLLSAKNILSYKAISNKKPLAWVRLLRPILLERCTAVTYSEPHLNRLIRSSGIRPVSEGRLRRNTTRLVIIFVCMFFYHSTEQLQVAKLVNKFTDDFILETKALLNKEV